MAERVTCETVADHEWTEPVIEQVRQDGLGRLVLRKRRRCMRCGRTQRFDEAAPRSAYAPTVLFHELP